MHALQHQHAYLLTRIGNEKGLCSWSKLTSAKKALGAIGLDLQSTRDLMQTLASDGYVSVHQRGKGVSYALSAAGRTYLDGLAAAESPENPELRGYQNAYLLLQLLSADGQALDKKAANKFSKPVREDLDLNTAGAGRLRVELVSKGLIRSERSGRDEIFHLTDAGRERLAHLPQHPAIVFSLKGSVLNLLLGQPKRDGDGNVSKTAPPAIHTNTPVPVTDLSEAAYAEFEHLRREKYSHVKSVPIFEVRRRIAQKYGEGSAMHDVLDEAILELWRRGRVRVSPISDMNDATEDQRADSINDSYQTLFYMENVDVNGSGS